MTAADDGREVMRFAKQMKYCDKVKSKIAKKSFLYEVFEGIICSIKLILDTPTIICVQLSNILLLALVNLRRNASSVATPVCVAGIRPRRGCCP
jgi:hypothetical protein